MRRIVVSLASIVLAMLTAVGLASVVWEERAQAAFPGTNGKIAFTRDPDGPRGSKDPEIYTVWFDGDNLKRLTNNSMQDSGPAWSPDGKKIAFSEGPRAYGRQDIFVMKANGSGKTLVTNERKMPGRAREDDSEPAFSPNGRQIVFVREGRNDYGKIFKIGANGKNPTRISYGVYHPRSLAWSPKGTWIAYSDRYDSYEPETYVVTMRPDGSRKRYRAEGSTPNWSPDGTQIVFAGPYHDEIKQMAASGTGVKRLMRHDSYNENPAFSPGGGKIVFSSDRDGDYDLYMMDADGTGVKRITNLPGDEYDPDWQPIR